MSESPGKLLLETCSLVFRKLTKHKSSTNSAQKGPVRWFHAFCCPPIKVQRGSTFYKKLGSWKLEATIPKQIRYPPNIELLAA